MSKKKKNENTQPPVDEKMTNQTEAENSVPEQADAPTQQKTEVQETAPVEPAEKKDSKNSSKIEITKIKVIGEEKISGFKKTLDEALDENAEDLGHAESATVVAAQKISLRQVASTIFGFFVLVFAVIGIISVVSRVSDYIESLDDDSALVEALTDTVAPLAATDASVFENTSMISEDVLISSACWDIIFNPSTAYTAIDGNYTISFLDIDKRIANLFGAGLTYTHKTVGDEELLFEYDEETGMYTIPAYPSTLAYLPKLTEYTPTADGYILKVEYVFPITEYVNADSTAEKVMRFTVKANGSEFIITSLELEKLITGQEL